MLYDTFRISVMISSAFGILHMLATESYTYMFFPLMGLLWGVYSFFDENDKEYVRRNGTYDKNAKKSSWWWADLDYDSDMTTYRGTTYNRFGTTSYKNYRSKEYEHIATKCKRNFKITVGDKKNG